MLDLPSLTSLLFVPAVKPRFVASAAAGQARAIIVDLEDSVPPDRKAEARARLPDIVRLMRASGKQVFVRVNHSSADDLEACREPDIDGVFLPKVSGREAVLSAAATLSRPGRRPLALVPMIEGAAGVLSARSIAKASKDVLALMFGAGDFVADTGFACNWRALAIPASIVALAAKAEGKLAWGLAGSIAILDDIEALSDLVRASRSIGYSASPVIHPKQLACVDAEFGPNAHEIAEAETIVAAFEASGGGATLLDRRLIERPAYLQAIALLRRVPGVD